MTWLRVGLRRLTGLFGQSRRERELAAEIESNLQLHIDDNIRAGMTHEQARREARLKFGGVEAVKEEYRERSSIPLIEYVVQDLRFGFRQLARNPGFSFTTIIVLALGLCSSIAIFAFVDAALIRPLPYREPSRLVAVDESNKLFPRSNLSYQDYLDWKRLNRVFSSFAVYTSGGVLMKTAAGVEPVSSTRVSDRFFHTLGVTPQLGRDFSPGEDEPGAPNNVILSFGAWQARFGGSKDVIGRKVILNGAPNTIIGVLPKDFHFAPSGTANFFATTHELGNCEKRRSCHSMYGIARLKDGVSVETALAEMNLIAKQLEQQYPDSNRGQSAFVSPLADVIIGNVKPVLLTLLGGAALLLLIACINVCSLLLVRAESRRREMAVRTSLGASFLRIAGQYCTESSILVAFGCVFGLLASHWAMRLLTGLIPADMLAAMPYLEGVGLTPRVLFFAVSICIFSVLLFSIAPALRRPSADMRGEMAEGSRGSAGITWRRLGAKLVVLELATAMVLLVGAGLLGKSLHHLLNVELAFQPDHLALLAVAASDATYSDPAKNVALARKVVSQAEGIAGVKSAGLTTVFPVSLNGNTDWIRVVGHPYNGEHNEVNERDVSADYFKALQVKLLRGRFFSDDEDATKQPVAIINQTFAKKYFPGEDPIGRQIGDTQLSAKSLKVIVGIVDDLHEGALDDEIWPAEYHPFNQDPSTFFGVIARTSQAEHSVLPALTASIRQIDPELGTLQQTTMAERIKDSPTAYLHRSSSWLVGAFAAVALVLGVVGLYGVVAYSVSQRTREIGVRMALGAERSTVYKLILREAGWLTAIGIAGGLVASIAGAISIKKLLFDVQSWDLQTLAEVSLVLGVASLAASFVPARRAATVNPVEALRGD